MSSNIVIRTATADDAPTIAHAVAMAIGDEVALRNYCGDDYLAVLTEVASHKNTQYSWQYALVAEVEGAAADAVVGYDGARLVELREGTFSVLRENAVSIPTISDETEAGEIYLDSVGVLPEFRGVGRRSQIGRSILQKGLYRGARTSGIDCRLRQPKCREIIYRTRFRTRRHKKILRTPDVALAKRM